MTYANQGQPIDISRNIFISHALQHNAQHIFFLDSDVELPHDGLVKLYNAKRPIIAGVYSGRSPPYGLSANINRQILSPEILNKYPDGIMEVHEIGMGCTLIDMRVIERMARMNNMKWRCIRPHAKELGVQLRPDETSPKEIAKFSNDEAKGLQYKCGYCQSLLITDFFDYTTGKERSETVGMFSEDYYFCQRARDVGFPIAIHTGVFGEHELTAMKITREGLHNPTESAGTI
jgi:hypothetical protein